jgi:predicted SAM-dependent methyltransferase
MKLLNVGCGARYSKMAEWINIDILSTGEGVIVHDLKKGIPYPDNSFDLVYHSHVLEHIPKEYAGSFLTECIRVLRPGGILRVVIPDLEQIVRTYLSLLEKGLQAPDDLMNAANYDWMMLEMYDQTVRNKSGGEMLACLSKANIPNQDFILQRCGYEAKNLMELLKAKPALPKIEKPLSLVKRLYGFLVNSPYRKKILLKYLLKEEYETLQQGIFRQGGEVHQWMYDRYSLIRLFTERGMESIVQRAASESYCKPWSGFNLDTQANGSIYKPDSLYMEGIKRHT